MHLLISSHLDKQTLFTKENHWLILEHDESFLFSNAEFGIQKAAGNEFLG